MNSRPDSNVKLQEKKKKVKSLKMPSLSHMHYESLNAMQHCPNGFDNGMPFSDILWKSFPMTALWEAMV